MYIMLVLGTSVYGHVTLHVNTPPQVVLRKRTHLVVCEYSIKDKILDLMLHDVSGRGLVLDFW